MSGSAAISRHLRRETAISVAISMAMSAVFFVAVFGRAELVPIWHGMGLAADMAPQSFMVGLMAALVPALLTRKRIVAGDLPGLASPQSQSVVVGRAFALAIVAVVVGGGGGVAFLSAAGLTTIPSHVALVFKVVFGGVEAAIVTTAALRALVASASPPDRRET